jgi:hypothetical protein
MKKQESLRYFCTVRELYEKDFAFISIHQFYFRTNSAYCEKLKQVAGQEFGGKTKKRAALKEAASACIMKK